MLKLGQLFVWKYDHEAGDGPRGWWALKTHNDDIASYEFIVLNKVFIIFSDEKSLKKDQYGDDIILILFNNKICELKYSYLLKSCVLVRDI